MCNRDSLLLDMVKGLPTPTAGFHMLLLHKVGPFPDTVHWSCRSTVDVRSTSGRCPSYRSRRAQTSHTNSNFANREEKLHSSSVSTSGAGYTQALDIYCSNGATEELFCYSRMLIPEYIQCRFFANKIFIFLKDTLPVFLQISP